MRRLLLILLIVTAGLDAFAVGYRVRGRVTDATGAPLPGSVVHLDENYLWAVTDLDGNFVLEGVEAGSYQLKTECLGFVSDVRNLQVFERIHCRIKGSTGKEREKRLSAYDCPFDKINSISARTRSAI